MFGHGISVVSVVNGGVGYYGNPTINVTDGLGNGSGAVLSISNGINQYGQILPDGVEILFNGRNYLDPLSPSFQIQINLHPFRRLL